MVVKKNMCKTAEEIRASDYTCITLDEFIRIRKKEVNGNKESLAYLDILRAEASIQNRITTLQTQEDMLSKFQSAEDALTNTNVKIDGLVTKFDDHLEECVSNPTLQKKMRDSPAKFWGGFTLIFLGYFVVFRLIEIWIGLGEFLKALLNMIPGVDIS